MLREVEAVKQVPGEPRRRWFSSPECDLYVWFDDRGIPVGFHLAYDKGSDEHALVWNAPKVFSHVRIDSGETHPLQFKSTPILVTDGLYDGPRLAGLFARESRELPREIADLVARKIDEFASPQAPSRA